MNVHYCLGRPSRALWCLGSCVSQQHQPQDMRSVSELRQVFSLGAARIYTHMSVFQLVCTWSDGSYTQSWYLRNDVTLEVGYYTARGHISHIRLTWRFVTVHLLCVSDPQWEWKCLQCAEMVARCRNARASCLLVFISSSWLKYLYMLEMVDGVARLLCWMLTQIFLRKLW